MTVSRTINGHPYVAEETARKVHEAIRLLGYRPNHAARMLTGQLSRSIGLIVPDLSDTFFSVVSHAVQETAREHGHLVWLAASDEDPSIEEAQVEMMMHHPVDGILLVPCDTRAKYLKGVAGGTTPVVTIDRPMEVATTDSVGVENRAGAAMAVEHLLGHGYQKIACVAANSHLITIKERIAGYREGMRRAGLPLFKEANLPTQSVAHQILAEMLSGASRPDAIFAANNASTIWVIECLKEMNLGLGRDVALVGFDDVDFFTLITPAVTAVRQPAAELGNVSTRLLLQRINGEFKTSSVRTVLPVTLTVRESCGCQPRSKSKSGLEFDSVSVF
jgi:LacI family transcriptional regulator